MSNLAKHCATPLDLLRDGWALDPLYEQLPLEPPATGDQRGKG